MAGRNKYHAHRLTTPEGTFDSRREYCRWQELRRLERAGEIAGLRRQCPFPLIPACREPDTTGPRGGVRRGKLIEQPVYYVADFVYLRDGETVVEDCKGVRTPDYIIKRKLMLHIHGIRIRET